MKKSSRQVFGALVLPIVLGLLWSSPAGADVGEVLKWIAMPGIIQTNNVVGSGTGAVTGGGQPWTTLGGGAHVNLRTGRVQFQVRGLVFAGGNSIGTPGPVTQIKGTLVCDTDGSAGGGNSVLVDTPLVPLDARGDALFNGMVALDPVCFGESDIAFLIRTGTGRWISNGAVLLSHE
jgi:hypothetical protein